MKIKITILAATLTLMSLWAAASPRKNDSSTSKSNAAANSSAGAPLVHSSEDADAARVEGERRFRANCGRCHAAPQKFPPRMMATIVRHMRVRATITDEDMRLILSYMTQ